MEGFYIWLKLRKIKAIEMTVFIGKYFQTWKIIEHPSSHLCEKLKMQFLYFFWIIINFSETESRPDVAGNILCPGARGGLILCKICSRNDLGSLMNLAILWGERSLKLCWKKLLFINTYAKKIQAIYLFFSHVDFIFVVFCLKWP
jgi:hypothetical protein